MRGLAAIGSMPVRTNYKTMEKYTLYKGYKIKEIYQSADGRGNYDYFISTDKNPQGEVKMNTTLTKVKIYIVQELLKSKS